MRRGCAAGLEYNACHRKPDRQDETEMLSIVPSLLILGPVALAALLLALNRPSLPEGAEARGAASRVFFWATLVQGVHFMEEALTGFHIELPALFGLPPIPLAVFMAFNLIWIVIWLASIPGIGKAVRFAFFAAWFLGIAGVINLAAHPILAIVKGGYFPGLVTAPIIGILAILLCLRLWRATASPAQRKKNV
jgi:hypothetical protein